MSRFAGGKPFGVCVVSGVPATDALAREVNWRWMLLSPAGVAGSDAIKLFCAYLPVVAASQK